MAAGCGGRSSVQSGAPAPSASAPAPSQGNPKTPALVDVHSPVSDEEYQEAVKEIGTDPPGKGNLDSYYALGQYQYNHGNFAEALKTYQRILLAPVGAFRLDRAQYMVGQSYYDKKDLLPALAAFQTVLQKYPRSPFASQAKQMTEFMLGYSLGLEDLKRFTANYPDSPMICQALYQLGSRQAQSGDRTAAAGSLSAFLDQCPGDPSAGAAQLLLSSLQEQQQGKSWKIGVLVPSSGRYRALGQSVVNGITLAMEQANQSGGTRKPTSVVVKDTMGNGLQAVKVFQDMTKDDSVDAILGLVLPEELSGVAPKANDRRIVVLSSALNQDGLSSLGPYLFSNSMTNEMQGRAMAKYAVEKLGLRKLAILAPDDDKGQARGEAFRQAAESMGATILADESYVTNSTDFRKQLIALGGQDPQSSKDNDRENNRRFEELKYALGKEIGKIRLKARDAGAKDQVSAAFVPLVEGLSNTLCPSVVKGVNDALRDDFKAQEDWVVRSDDLVHQALGRLPVEYRGTTLPVTGDLWGDVGGDLNASLIVAGRVLQLNKPDEAPEHPTWDFSLVLEAFQLNPRKGTYSRIYQGKVGYSTFKPSSLIRSQSGYQGLYLPAHPAEIPSLASQIHFYDLNPVLLGSHTWGNDAVLQEGGKDLDGAYYITGFYPDSSQGPARKFTEDYLKAYAVRPDLLAAQAFDAARLLLRAIDASNGRDDIHLNLMNIRDFDGVSGRTTFGGHGEAEKVLPVLRIQGGKLQQVQ